MKFRQFKPKSHMWAPLIVISAAFLICACGGGGDSSSNTGSISFNLDWVHPGPESGLERSPSGNVCVDYLIKTISVELKNSSGATVANKSWKCTDRKGAINDVPPASGYSLIIDGIVDSEAVWRNQTTGIKISEGKNTDLGTIEMAYIGDDQTRPEIADQSPDPGETEVFLNAKVLVTFSEDVVAASVNASSCKLVKDGTTTQVPCTINYSDSTHTATIIPNNSLTKQTVYRVTVTTEVQDHASLTMASNQTWTFTTGLSDGEFLIWDQGNWGVSLWEYSEE